jgi:hypothetical protein
MGEKAILWSKSTHWEACGLRADVNDRRLHAHGRRHDVSDQATESPLRKSNQRRGQTGSDDCNMQVRIEFWIDNGTG